MDDRPETRPEIEPWFWDPEKEWENRPFFNAKEKPVLIISDPPYFDKNADEYAEKKDPLGHQPVCDVFKITPMPWRAQQNMKDNATLCQTRVPWSRTGIPACYT
jgi:hypothetical protein